MSTAQSIDFLPTQPTTNPLRIDWSKLASHVRKRLLGHSHAPKACLQSQDGGFVFAPQSTITFQSSVASGLIGTLIFGLVGAFIATGSTSSTGVMTLGSRTVNTATTTMRLIARPVVQSSTIEAAKENNVPIKKVENPPTKSVVTNPNPAQSQTAATQSPPALKKEVFGFMPYWFVDTAVGNIDYSLLTSLAYFDVALNPDGSVDTDAYGWKWIDADSTQKIFSEARQSNVRLVMTFSALDDEVIESILMNPAHAQNAINSMVAVSRTQGATGLNIDFEYTGKPSDELRSAYTRFVKQATEKYHAEFVQSEVTVSTTPAAAQYTMLNNVAELQQVTDGLFVMAYDYATIGSSHAGPVAPLSGAPKAYWYDVSSTVQDYIDSGVPANKIILGVPYYGYDWPTMGQSPKSEVVTGKRNMANYSGVKKALEQGVGERRWDDAAQVPYLVYSEDGVDRIAYYDDAESLGKKYDLINSKELKGVGIWALGQDGGAKELWQLLEEKFANDQS